MQARSGGNRDIQVVGLTQMKNVLKSHRKAWHFIGQLKKHELKKEFDERQYA